MKSIWFKRKTYGWGWTPCTWQGWLVMAVFVLFLVWQSFQTTSALQSIGGTVIAVVLLLGITYATGESPRWQWGEKK